MTGHGKRSKKGAEPGKSPRVVTQATETFP